MIQGKVDYEDVTRFVKNITRYQIIERRELSVATREGTAIIHREGKKRSPVDTSRTRNSIGLRVGIVRGMPMGLVEVGTQVYPEILNKSGRHHYRRGPRAGQTTAGWFSGVVRLTKIISGVEKRFTFAFHRIINIIKRGR